MECRLFSHFIKESDSRILLFISSCVGSHEMQCTQNLIMLSCSANHVHTSDLSSSHRPLDLVLYPQCVLDVRRCSIVSCIISEHECGTRGPSRVFEYGEPSKVKIIDEGLEGRYTNPLPDVYSGLC